MGEIIVILKFSKVYKDIFRERNNTFFYYSSGELESGIERANKVTITSLAYFPLAGDRYSFFFKLFT